MILNALILTGGESQRMGQPKALLDYHGMPQYRHIASLAAPFCTKVYIGCRTDQNSLFATMPCINDQDLRGSIGPMNALLSAFEVEQVSWLVLGCDYPFLEHGDIAQLAEERNVDMLGTAFMPKGQQIPEPLIAIYEAKAVPFLEKWLQNGHQSLRYFLTEHSIHYISPRNPDHLQSVDHFTDYLNIQQRIKNGPTTDSVHPNPTP